MPRADRQHAVCLGVARTGGCEATTLEQSPEAIDEWATALRERFDGDFVGMAKQSQRGDSIPTAQLSLAQVMARSMSRVPVGISSTRMYCISGVRLWLFSSTQAWTHLRQPMQRDRLSA